MIQHLRNLAVDADLAGKTVSWQFLASAANRLEEFVLLQQKADLAKQLQFWERWCMDWRTTNALINNAVEKFLETGEQSHLRRAIDLYSATRTAYSQELRATLKLESSPDQ
jgi:ABC-type transporter lipoprotein component MlaA